MQKSGLHKMANCKYIDKLASLSSCLERPAKTRPGNTGMKTTIVTYLKKGDDNHQCHITDDHLSKAYSTEVCAGCLGNSLAHFMFALSFSFQDAAVVGFSDAVLSALTKTC